MLLCAVNSLKAVWNSLSMDFKKVYSKDGTTLPNVGDIVKLPKLAASLDAIATDGASAFYNGSLSLGIVQAVKKSGGILTADDLKAYKVEETEALHTNFNGDLSLWLRLQVYN